MSVSNVLLILILFKERIEMTQLWKHFVKNLNVFSFIWVETIFTNTFGPAELNLPKKKLSYLEVEETNLSLWSQINDILQMN